jgi:hypothetical protein
MARAVANGKIGDFAAAVVGIRLRTDAIGDCQPDRPNRSNGSYAISKPPAVFNVVLGDIL